MINIPLNKIWEVKLLQEEYNRVWEDINRLIEKEAPNNQIKIEYVDLLTKEEEQLFLNEYNKNNLEQHSSIEYLSAKEIIKKYGHTLTEQQLEKLKKYDDKR